jgi:WD40 repeat protein/predicted Ser/Thr protein kinase
MLNSKAALGEPPTGIAQASRALKKSLAIEFGDYVLGEEIAHGGMGVVYRAQQMSLNRTVALKLLLLGRYSSTESVERFHREAQSAAALRHPNIVAIHEVGEHDGQHFLAMEFVDGRDLSAVVHDGPLAPTHAAEIVVTVARAIHYAHEQGILHRDLKSSNVILDVFGKVHVTDFGLAKRLDGSTDLTVTGQMIGTPNYLSPEQAAGHQNEIGPASDLYSIGALLYELLTGRPPFLAESVQEALLRIRDAEPVRPRALNPTVPPDLETICLKCLQKIPSRRYTTANDLADDLSRWLRREPIAARPIGKMERLLKWSRRNPKIVTLVLLLLSVLFLGLFGILNVSVRLAAANRAKDRANVQLAKHGRDLEWQKIDELVASGKRADALAHLSHFLRENPQDGPAATRVVAMLSACNFGLLALAPLPHGAPVNQLDLSADGKHLLTAADDGKVRLWDLDTGRLLASLAHPVRATHGFFVGNEASILTLCHDGSCRLWNWREDKIIFDFPRSPDSFGSSLSPDRRYALLLETDTNARLWDLTAQQALGASLALPARVRYSDFSPDSKQVALAGADGTVGVWEVKTAQPRFAPVKLPGDVTRVKFSPDGKTLVAAWQSKLTLCDAGNGAVVKELRSNGGQVLQAEFTPDGQRIISMAYNRPIVIWDVAAGQVIGQPIHAELGCYFCFSPDGTKFATRAGSGVNRVWDAFSGLPLSEPFEHDGPMTDLKFTPDGQRLATTSQDGTARLWRVQPAIPSGLILKTSDSQPAACFSQNGRFIYRASNHCAEIFDLRNGQRLGQPMAHQGDIYRIKTSPDGKRLATASWDGTGRIWKANTGEPLSLPLRHRWRLFALAFSPDNRLLATGAAEGVARLWNVENGEPVGPELVHQGEVNHVCFSPDSRALLTSTAAGTAHLWSVETGQPLWPEPLPHQGNIRMAEFSPDGKRIVTASADRSARVWDAQSRQLLTPPLLHERGVSVACFSPDGTRILTCSEDGTARVWDAKNGTPISQPMRDKDKLTCGTFSPNGRLILTGSQSGAARLWDAHTGYPVSEPLLHGRRLTGVEFSPDGAQCLSVASADSVRLWTVREAPVPVPDWFCEFIEAVGGKRLNERGDVSPAASQVLSPFTERGAGADQFYARWTQWFLLERKGDFAP